MNLPLNSLWQDEILILPFNGAKLVSFDIWGGMNVEDKTNGGFRGKDFEYMTLMYSTKNVPLEVVWSCPPAFLSSNDNNVERALTAKIPILHNRSLIEKDHILSLNKFVRRFNIEDDSSHTVLVPVSESVENRWKSSLCFSFVFEGDENPSMFLNRHQKALIALSDKIYNLWHMFEGKGFNLYKIRKTFSDNAVQIANLMADGFSTRVMAEKLHISRSGVEYHIESMRQTLGAKNRGNLIAELFRKGIIF